MFKITGKKGFHITFENGFTVSVQFGPGNYCDNYDMEIGRDDERAGAKGSYNAECAVWGSDGVMIDRWDGNTVSNRSTAEEVLSLLNWASAQQSLAPDAPPESCEHGNLRGKCPVEISSYSKHGGRR